MNELSEELKNYMVVFIDGSHKEITKSQAHNILNAMDKTETIIMHDGLIRLSSITKLLPVEEFYRQYPEKKIVGPETRSHEYNSYKNEPILAVDRILKPIEGKNKRVRALEGMIKSITQSIDTFERQGHSPTGAKELRKYMQKRLDDVRKENIT